jgi:hypothetical protein
LGGELGDQPFRAVVAEDGDHVAALHAQLGKAVGEVVHPPGVLRPCHRLPDPVPLLLQRDRPRPGRGVHGE